MISLYCLQVSRLMLLAGANPNTRTEFMNHAPMLCVASAEGHVDMVSLLLEFSANVMQTGDDHICALSHAARQGHIEVIRHLVIKKAKVGISGSRSY